MKIWHSSNRYARQVEVKKDPDQRYGTDTHLIVGNPRQDLFKKSGRRLRRERGWVTVATKKIVMGKDGVSAYVRALQELGRTHAGKRSVGREGQLKSFPSSDCVSPGLYDEYRLELSGIFRESFLSDGQDIWRWHSWNFAELRKCLGRVRGAIRGLQKGQDYARNRAIRNTIEPLFRSFVRYEKPSGVTRALASTCIPSEEHIPDRYDRLIGRLRKVLTGDWPPYRPPQETPKRKELRRLVWREYQAAKRQHPYLKADAKYAKEIEKSFRSQGISLSAARIRNILGEKKRAFR